MNLLPPLAATIPDLSEMAKTGASGQSAMGNLAVLVIVLLVIALGFVIWAMFLRKPQGRRERGMLQDAPVKEPHAEGPGRRRRRRTHRGKNPTLAETGGLPPARDDESSGTTP